jgi:hypothetical protein
VAVQCWFADGKRHRDYFLLHRPAQGKGLSPARPAKPDVLSFADLHAPGDLDLRRREDARALEEVLAAVDLDGLA